MTTQLWPDRPKKIHLIDTEEKVGYAVEHLLKFDVLGYDTETYHAFDRAIPAFHPCNGARMRLAQWATPEGDSYVFNLYKVSKDFLYYMFPNKFLCVIHNAKFEIKFLQFELGIYDFGPIWDTMVVEQVLSKGRVNPKEKGEYIHVGLDACAKRRLDVELPKGEQASQWYKEDLTESQIRYAARDPQVVLPLYQKQYEALLEQSQVRVAELECGVIPAIAWMENNGFRLNGDAWTQVVDDLVAHKKEVQTELWPLLGNQGTLFGEQTLNLDSKPQVTAAFQRLGLEIPIDKDGNMTLSSDLLRKIEGRKDVDLFVDYVSTTKRVQSFGYNWVDKINPYTGRIHCDLKQIGAETGRMACSAPNLMQIPKENTYRNCFEAEEGWVLVDADYSQCELRILAEYCRDPNLLAAFDSEKDIHYFTGHLLYEKPIDKVTKDERGIAKNQNFLIVYGGGPSKLAMKANIPIAVAERTMELYLKKVYPHMAHWLEARSKQVLFHLRADTMTGRLRQYMGDIKDREFKGKIQRNAKNMPIQGTNADLTKLAMTLCYRRIVREQLVDQIHLLLVVHDELVAEAQPSYATYASELMHEEMITAEKMYLKRVPSVVDGTLTRVWCKDPKPEHLKEAQDLIDVQSW